MLMPNYLLPEKILCVLFWSRRNTGEANYFELKTRKIP